MYSQEETVTVPRSNKMLPKFTTTNLWLVLPADLFPDNCPGYVLCNFFLYKTRINLRLSNYKIISVTILGLKNKHTFNNIFFLKVCILQDQAKEV